ncbi:MAG: TonB-dependent receptor [Candidatus Eisenbacteria bacterium]|nr:TonB-dependent receptor [Candidatus Eisenbacteria bacterium]
MKHIVAILVTLGILLLGIGVSAHDQELTAVTRAQAEEGAFPAQNTSDLTRGQTRAEPSAEDLVFMEIPVVFAASKFEQPSTEAPATVSIITADDIQRYGYRTLDEALQGVTGLYVTYDDNYRYLGVRGYSIPGDYNSRVLLLVDGMASNDDIYGSATFGTVFGVDMDQVKQIEIIKGPGSALYGTNALFAVINVVTKDAKDSDGLRVSAEYGSYDSRKGLMSYGKRHGDLDFVVAGSYANAEGQDRYFPEYDGYVDEAGIVYDGTFRNGDWDRSPSIWGKLSYKQFALRGWHKTRDKGIPTAAYWTVFNDNRTNNTDESEFLELRYAPTLDETKDLLARVYYNRYRYYGDWMLLYEGESDYYEEMGKDVAKGDWIGSELQLNWKTSARNRLTAGGEAQYHSVAQKYWDEGLLGSEYRHQYLDYNQQFDVWSLYAQDIYKLSSLSFVLGARYDNYPTFGGTTNPRVGCIYTPFDKTNIKLLYGTAFRAPSPYELYYHDGYYLMEPNESLTPERLKTTELVLEQGIARNVKALFSLYHTDLTNLIYQVVTADTGIEGDPLLQFRNVGCVQASGLEFTLDGTFSGVLTRFGYSYQETRDQHGKEQLVNSPNSSGNFSISVPILSGNEYVSAEVRYVGKRFTTSREELDPYVSTNLILFMKDLLPHIEITAKVNNVFDVSYEDPCSTEYFQTRIPQDGRSFFLKLTYRSQR